MKFELKIECDNAAFDPDHGQEVARILRDAAAKLEQGYTPARSEGGLVLRDFNGNKVGIAGYTCLRRKYA